MRSIRKALVAVPFGAALVLTPSCAPEPTDGTIPVIEVAGSRAREFRSLDELAEQASAVILAHPTGEQSEVPLPPEQGGTADSAPTVYVRLAVERVIAGSLDAAEIDLVSPGIDQRTGRWSLREGGPYVLFVTPAMYAAGEPAGGYVAVGGPAGVFASPGRGDAFVRVDAASTRLPERIVLGTTPIPAPTASEAELIRRGPR